MGWVRAVASIGGGRSAESGGGCEPFGRSSAAGEFFAAELFEGVQQSGPMGSGVSARVSHLVEPPGKRLASIRSERQHLSSMLTSRQRHQTNTAGYATRSATRKYPRQ